MDNTISFRLTKVKDAEEFREVELDNLTVSEANAFKNVLDSFIALSKMYNDDNAIIKIKKGSAQADFIPSTEATYLRVVKDMNDVIENKCLKKSIIDEYNKIQKVCANENYQLTIERTDKDAKVIDLNKFFIRKHPFYKKRAKRSKTKVGLEFISGELFDLGGKKINAHITNNKGETIVIDIDRKEDARKLGNYLYSNAFICALKYQSDTVVRWKFVDNYSDENEKNNYELFVNQLKELELVDRYEKIYDLVYEILQNDQLLELKLRQIVKHLKLLVNENADKGLLMTILLALSQFKENKIVVDLYRRTNDIYKFKNN